MLHGVSRPYQLFPYIGAHADNLGAVSSIPSSFLFTSYITPLLYQHVLTDILLTSDLLLAYFVAYFAIPSTGSGCLYSVFYN